VHKEKLFFELKVSGILLRYQKVAMQRFSYFEENKKAKLYRALYHLSQNSKAFWSCIEITESTNFSCFERKTLIVILVGH